ncbi:hypothetical protein JP75_12705 [Devosia riboflavina]|uniref:Uncharacterized protein n=1 Tax=Devosia riboflavina TaxID=46914 RepID=A0A087M1U2_9HYPH|nr:hypothetical protein [Devosia riboflavina]KFL30845.1 hypothetical protein JP75_12705 [Devosia riboflavina]
MSALPRSEPRISGLMQNLAGIALVVMLAALGVAYLVDEAGRSDGRKAPSLEDGEALVQTVGGRELTIPKNWFRFGEQMQSGFVGQVDLSVELPLGRVDVTLLPRSRAKSSSELLDSVYVHQFAKGTETGVPGLIGQKLEGNGYAGEVIWYDALAPKPFVAKCIDAIEADAPDKCVRTVHLASGLAAIYSFDETLLPAWRDFDAEMGQWLERIGAN